MTFWAHVDKRRPSDCWLWTGCIDARGYGRWGRRGRAHRVAYELYYGGGPVPFGRSICHRCDVRHCCNPAHLFMGTHADNNKDMRDKGRAHYVSGERNGFAKLTAAQVADIKRRAKRGNYSALAREFGVHNCTIGRLARNEWWKHIAAAEKE